MAQVFHTVRLPTKSWCECPSELNDEPREVIAGNIIMHRVRHNHIVSSVRARLSSQQGISFTEFTYQLLQAYDFHHLHKHHGCSIQIGGSDQWGNIVAGLELIGRLKSPIYHGQSAPEAYGITTPLLTTSSGEKFGKSAGNAIWLEPNLTSIFDFYQVRLIFLVSNSFFSYVFSSISSK